ncbi:hypothetical protein EDB81DRAFT_910881 [Dactylonectria macrodidyma]|uniref:Uncharacterized protein n=1 Tax=Dactylonectria macrodidyma TaxID=307937 RepID=A0A9P9DVL6_9HYPO|nr:hypothetical protein EDB81DRAFT_910881 [Dactylonectria macrodidyma]
MGACNAEPDNSKLTYNYDRQHQPRIVATSPSGWEEIVCAPIESPNRRKLELQLFHHYKFNAGWPLAVDKKSEIIWESAIPHLAIESDALLYSMYALSRLRLATRDPGEKECHMDVCHIYLGMTVREHAKEIPQLSKDNREVVWLTSDMLRRYYLAVLQERPLLTSAISHQLWLLENGNAGSASGPMIKPIPVNNHLEASIAKKNRQGPPHLLRRRGSHELAEGWDSELIGGIWVAMSNEDPLDRVCEMIIDSPRLGNTRFIELVEEQSPRALVILAHYFRHLQILRTSWWVGDAGQREIQAISEVLPRKWKDVMFRSRQELEQQEWLS